MTGYDYVVQIRQHVPKAQTLDQATLLRNVNTARLIHATFTDPIVRYVSFFFTGQREYSLSGITGYTSNQILKLFSVLIQIDENTLQYEIRRRYREEIPMDTLQGYPIFYYLVGDTIGFYPVPVIGKAILKLSIKPEELGLASQEIFDDIHHPAIIFLACAYTAMATGDAALATFFQERYREHRQVIVTRLK